MLETYPKQNYNDQNSLEMSRDLVNIFQSRRTIRNFSGETPSSEIIKNAIDVARLSPSGANRQPWSFVLISCENLKNKMRKLAEQEEYLFYNEKPNKKWIEDLKHLHTSEDKSFLTKAPYIIVIFYKHFDMIEGEKQTNYYAKESVGIATGMLISALHMSGLSTLTYTPARMKFLSGLLDRPCEEKPFMVLGVGLPHQNAKVPTISKKNINDILKTYHKEK